MVECVCECALVAAERRTAINDGEGSELKRASKLHFGPPYCALRSHHTHTLLSGSSFIAAAAAAEAEEGALQAAVQSRRV